MPRQLVELSPMWGIAAYLHDGVLYSPVDGTTEEGARHYELNRHLYPGPDPAYPRGRERMSVTFRCPVHAPEECEYHWLMVPFENPLDGGPKAHEGQGLEKNHWWTVVSGPGSDFTTLTLTPSILFPSPEIGPEHWHGHIVDGAAIP